MEKIVILGWYGTETIGDRAILAGIISILGNNYDSFEIHLGSLYPFVSEITLIDDCSFYKKCLTNSKFGIELFDSQNIKDLKKNIEWCDLLIMGGGPLMGPWDLYMIEYAFFEAKKKKKKTFICGCGVGPLQGKQYERCLTRIVSNSDATIFRDQSSAKQYKEIAGAKAKEVAYAIDPAVVAAMKFKDNNLGIQKKDIIVASVRDFPMEYSINNTINHTSMNNKIVEFLQSLQESTGKELKLVPMHYFSIGGDDRIFMNKIQRTYPQMDITVQNDPLTLEQTLYEFASCTMCLGMRFHSIVLQTVLNGHNIVLDYTHPSKGKIKGFFEQINALDKYKDSYINLQNGDSYIDYDPQYVCDYKLLNDYISVYDETIKKIKFNE
jgi:polysaccharide pyruvyl transferase WcaK-like protein